MKKKFFNFSAILIIILLILIIVSPKKEIRPRAMLALNLFGDEAMLYARSLCVISTEYTKAKDLNAAMKQLTEDMNKKERFYYNTSLVFEYHIEKRTMVDNLPAYVVVPAGKSKQGTEEYLDGRMTVVLKNNFIYMFGGYCDSGDFVQKFTF